MSDNGYDEMLGEAKEELPDDLEDGDRFTIPEPDIEKEGNKTIIKNLKEIVAAFGRDRSHFAKYMLKELGTSGHYDNNLVLQGKFRRKEIKKRIEEYSEKYVICEECQRPDTQLIREKGVLLIKCDACGARRRPDD